MRNQYPTIALVLLLSAGPAAASFPALQTTTPDPKADAGKPLTFCSTLGGARLCAESLANAWCRQHGFATFVNWSSSGETGPDCRRDDRACAVVQTITCARVPIVSED